MVLPFPLLTLYATGYRSRWRSPSSRAEICTN